MNYLVPHDPPHYDQGLVPTMIKSGQRALSTVPGAQWILKVLDHFYRQVNCLVTGYKYRRQIRQDFHKLMQGWHVSDKNPQSAYRFCMRVYNLLNDSEERDQFVMAVVAFAQMDTNKAIAFFAKREQEYIDAYFNGILVNC